MKQDPKKQAGDKKNPMHLIPYSAAASVARALKQGADEYGPWNWRENPVKMSTYIGAMRRHIGEWQEGRDRDEKSGEHPLAHVAASCLLMLDAIKHGCVEDDRPGTDAWKAEAFSDVHYDGKLACLFDPRMLEPGQWFAFEYEDGGGKAFLRKEKHGATILHVEGNCTDRLGELWEDDVLDPDGECDGQFVPVNYASKPQNPWTP